MYFRNTKVYFQSTKVYSRSTKVYSPSTKVYFQSTSIRSNYTSILSKNKSLLWKYESILWKYKSILWRKNQKTRLLRVLFDSIDLLALFGVYAGIIFPKKRVFYAVSNTVKVFQAQPSALVQGQEAEIETSRGGPKKPCTTGSRYCPTGNGKL